MKTLEEKIDIKKRTLAKFNEVADVCFEIMETHNLDIEDDGRDEDFICDVLYNLNYIETIDLNAMPNEFGMRFFSQKLRIDFTFNYEIAEFDSDDRFYYYGVVRLILDMSMEDYKNEESVAREIESRLFGLFDSWGMFFSEDGFMQREMDCYIDNYDDDE